MIQKFFNVRETLKDVAGNLMKEKLESLIPVSVAIFNERIERRNAEKTSRNEKDLDKLLTAEEGNTLMIDTLAIVCSNRQTKDRDWERTRRNPAS